MYSSYYNVCQYHRNERVNFIIFDFFVLGTLPFLKVKKFLVTAASFTGVLLAGCVTRTDRSLTTENTVSIASLHLLMKTVIFWNSFYFHCSSFITIFCFTNHVLHSIRALLLFAHFNV